MVTSIFGVNITILQVALWGEAMTPEEYMETIIVSIIIFNRNDPDKQKLFEAAARKNNISEKDIGDFWRANAHRV
jgi:hypothetical protein